MYTASHEPQMNDHKHSTLALTVYTDMSGCHQINVLHPCHTQFLPCHSWVRIYTIFSFSFRGLLLCFSGKEQQPLGVREHQRLMNVKVSTFGYVERKSGSKGTSSHSHIRQQ